jgi:serine/threonine protein kinase
MIGEEHVLALPAGYQLGKYLFKGVLGSGGFGITYLAEDVTLNRKVAIKELLPNDFATRIDGTTVVAKTRSEKENLAWARARFVDEGRALAACEHPNVVDVYEMIEANGTAYMVTKYEEGRSLERWLRDLGRTPTESELRGILMPLLSGLDRVHRTGFLHRDIKPENIYITTDGRPVLLDFGSARQAITSRSMVMTSIISAGYAPFEQYHEYGNQGAWSDIYALGAVMYRAITGNKPPESVRRLQNDPCQKLAASHAGRYDARFLTAIDSALSVNESQRPQSVGEWRDMMGPGAEPVSSPRPASPPLGEQRGKKIAGPRKFLQAFPKQAAAAVVVLMLLALGAWFFARPKPVALVDTNTHQPADAGKQTTGEQLNAKQSHNDQSSPEGRQSSAGQPPLKEEQGPALQPPPGEQRPSTGQPVRAYGSGTSNPVPTQRPSPEQQARKDELAPQQLVVAQSPPNGDEAQSAPSGQVSKPRPEPSPVVSNSSTPGLTGGTTPLDPKLVGNWEGRPNGSKGVWDRQWEQRADGSYAISGSVTETGDITASDGKIAKYLDGASQPTEVLYKFVGNTLYTTDPDGSKTVWRLVSADSSNPKSTGSPTSGNQGKRARHTARPSSHSPGILHEIRKYMPF